MSIKSKLQYIIKTSLGVNIPNNKIIINALKNGNNGDYTTDVALVLSKELNKSPIDIASTIKNNIHSDMIEKVEVTNSGIINIFINREYLFYNVNEIISNGKNYGRSDYGNGKKINIGYLSYNNSIFNLREIIYGDTLSNIMSFAGYDVTRELYCNDCCLEKEKKELDNIRVSFDIFTSKERLYSEGTVDMVLNKLQKKGKCYIENDSLWLKTTNLLNSNDRLLINNEGLYSPFLSNLSYHINRLNNGYDKVINVISNNFLDSAVKFGIELFGYDSNKFEIINIGNVKIRGEENYKISLNEILNNICVNKLRYFLISKEFNDELNMDLELIKEDSMDNPICYIEKCYSTIALILRGKSYKIDDNYSTIANDTAYTILNKLTQFEDIIIDSVDRRSPNIIASYLYELASLFNSYYDVGEKNEYRNEELLIISAIRIVMDNASNILGLILREEI